MEKKIGLVFSGGGSRGAYQVGVWKALKETGLDSLVSAISGCSVGSLTASMFVQDSYESIVEIWTGLKKEDVLLPRNKTRDLPIDIQQLGTYIHREKTNAPSMFSSLGLLNIVSRYIDFNRLKKSPIELFITITDIMTKNGQPDYVGSLFNFYRKNPYGTARYVSLRDIYSKEELLSTILASCAIPLIYPPVRISGVEYYDGGLAERHPIAPILQSDCTDMLIISVYDNQHFPNLQSHVNQYGYKKYGIIQPKPEFHSILATSTDYNSSHFQYKFDLGYHDALSVLEQMYHV